MNAYSIVNPVTDVRQCTFLVLIYSILYMLDQRPLLYKGRTQIVASLASKMKHLVAALK